MTEGDLILITEHTIQYMDHVLWNCTLVTYIIVLINVNLVNMNEQLLWLDQPCSRYDNQVIFRYYFQIILVFMNYNKKYVDMIV